MRWGWMLVVGRVCDDDVGVMGFVAENGLDFED